MMISVCICTYKRDSLIETLDSVAAQVLPNGFRTEIVVIDNDAARTAETVVKSWVSGTSIPVKYAVEPARNIALARNRALALASGDFVALIDDDEVAETNWLSTLLIAVVDHHADVVIGRVDAIYPSQAPRWFVAADPLSRNWGPTGSLSCTGSSSNALLDSEIVKASGVRFDKAFGRSGGEDTDFFNRLHAFGAKIVVTNDAIARERIPPERLTSAYLRRRAMRAGQSYGIIRLRSLTPAGRVGFLAATMLKLAAFAAGAVVLVAVARSEALKLGIRSWLNFGKLRACAGYPLPIMY